MLVDDYAHHPSEVEATINAINSGWEGRRVVSVFNPIYIQELRTFIKIFLRL